MINKNLESYKALPVLHVCRKDTLTVNNIWNIKIAYFKLGITELMNFCFLFLNYINFFK